MIWTFGGDGFHWTLRCFLGLDVLVLGVRWVFDVCFWNGKGCALGCKGFGVLSEL